MDKCARRTFLQTVGLGAGAALVPALMGAKKQLKIGHTGITWGYRPENAEPAIKDVASQGYWGFETFGSILEALEPKGGLGPVLEANKLPLISAYCTVNLTDGAKRKDEVDKIVRWGRLIKKYGGSVAVIGPNNVKRPGYDFAAAKNDIVATLNDMCKALQDVGIQGVLHQHTGTCVEVKEEVYAVMEAVDTRVVKFGPDLGQLAKGGNDPVKVVDDFLSVIAHVHLKDWSGGPNWVQYEPLGQGKVDIKGILDKLEKSKLLKIAMVELDPENPRMPPLETVKVSKEYLKKLGYTLRS